MKKMLFTIAVLLTATCAVFAGHGETTGCNPCHAAHNSGTTSSGTLDGEGPLWNPDFVVTTSTFDMYGEGGGVLTGVVDAEPGGSSKLCLSCHDGETQTSIVAHDSAYDMASGTGDPQDLTASHPLGVIYEEGVSHLKLKTAINAATPLETGDKVQCGTCHDAHSTETDYLSLDNTSGALCKSCHVN